MHADKGEQRHHDGQDNAVIFAACEQVVHKERRQPLHDGTGDQERHDGELGDAAAQTAPCAVVGGGCERGRGGSAALPVRQHGIGNFA